MTQRVAFIFMLFGSDPTFLDAQRVAIHSLRKVTQREIVIMHWGLQPDVIQKIAAMNVTMLEADVLVPAADSKCATSIPSEKARLIESFTKARLFANTDFAHLTYVESDQLFLQPIDDLSHRELAMAAVGSGHCTGEDFYWNTGVIAIRPDAERFAPDEVERMLSEEYDGECDDGSQRFENFFFEQVGAHVSCLHAKYNCRAGYAADECGGEADTRVVHWSGERKPWKSEGEQEAERLKTDIGEQPAKRFTDMIVRWHTLHDEVVAAHGEITSSRVANAGRRWRAMAKR